MREKTVKSPGGRTYLYQADREAIIREYYLEGLSKSELARKYGCSFHAVSRNITRFAAENDKSTLLMKNKPIDSQAHQMSGDMKRHWHSWREDAIRREQKVAV